jgi:hypothetical protein
MIRMVNRMRGDMLKHLNESKESASKQLNEIKNTMQFTKKNSMKIEKN